MTVPCPRCPSGVVVLGEASWASPLGLRRSLWVEEPARCSRGCPLTPGHVERLLVAAYTAPARQVPLFQEAAG